MKKLKISQLAPGFRYLQTLALNRFTGSLREILHSKTADGKRQGRSGNIIIWSLPCSYQTENEVSKGLVRCENN